MACFKAFPIVLTVLTVLALTSLGLIFHPGPDVALAQGACQQDDIAGPVRIDRNVLVGGYKLCVEAEASKLSLGAASVSVAVLNAVTEGPVYDARVVIHNRHHSSGEEGWATALPVPERPEIYRVARMKLDYPGPWNLRVEVDGPLGRVETDVGTVTIPEPRQYWVGSLVFAGMSVFLSCGVAYVVWSIRRAQKRREAANAV